MGGSILYTNAYHLISDEKLHQHCRWLYDMLLAFWICKGNLCRVIHWCRIVEQYIKCLKLPNATTHVKLEFQDLKLGDRLLTSLENGCTNMGDNSKVNHLTIQNGRGDVIPLFYCTDSCIKESETITRPITSSDNTLVFNLTVGRPPAEGNPWYDIHYTCKYLWIKTVPLEGWTQYFVSSVVHPLEERQ